MKSTILVVDDDELLRRVLADRLQFWGHSTDLAESGEAALQQAKLKNYDLIMLDLKLPGISGLETLSGLKKFSCDADVIMLTAHGSVGAAVKAIKAGAADFLPKPADFDLLRAVVDRLLAKRQLLRVRDALTEQRNQGAPFIVGSSETMQNLVQTAKRAAQANTTVLLRGESGVGKQVIADYIHRNSARQSGPFVYINCVALSDDLIESTLFGHEKGSFTGATARKTGRFEAANGGTAFLDEIGDISPRLQTKLLHFLETGEFERVGGTQTMRVDCRIVAATNRNLEESTRTGEFRKDLFYRLNVISLAVPSLRERSEDIPILAQAFIDKYAEELKRGNLTLAPETSAILQQYEWPGNVRQLRNAIERMVVLSPTSTLTPDQLPPEVLAQDTPTGNAPSGLPLKAAMLEFKKQYIRRTLATNGGNQTRTAETLGVQRSFLNRLIKKLAIQPKP
jgi:DNA-binding NtrC family response regulator